MPETPDADAPKVVDFAREYLKARGLLRPIKTRPAPEHDDGDDGPYGAAVAMHSART